MGPTCNCSCKEKDESHNFDISNNLGYDDTNVFQDFQYHEHKIKTNKIKLDVFDHQYRNYSGPLIYHQIDQVYLYLDDICKSQDIYGDIICMKSFLTGLSLKDDWKPFLQHNEQPFQVFLQTLYIVNEHTNKMYGQKQPKLDFISDAEDLEINMFYFKIYCLIVCRGEKKTKAKLLFGLISKTIDHDFFKSKEAVTYNNERLRLILKHIFFVSCFMPKLMYLKHKEMYPESVRALS